MDVARPLWKEADREVHILGETCYLWKQAAPPPCAMPEQSKAGQTADNCMVFV